MTFASFRQETPKLPGTRKKKKKSTYYTIAHPSPHEPEHNAAKVEIDLVGIVEGPGLRPPLGDRQRHHLDLLLIRGTVQERRGADVKRKILLQAGRLYQVALEACGRDYFSHFYSRENGDQLGTT